MRVATRPALAILRAVAVIVLMAATLFPLVWMVSTAFKANSAVLVFPPELLPEQPTFDNFARIFSSDGTYRYFRNSLVATSVSTVLTLLLAIPAAFALGTHRFPRNAGRPVGLGFLLLRFLPPFAVVIPLFLMLRTADLIDSVLALVLVYTAFHLPIAIWVIQPAVRQLPKEIIEAAFVDGAGPARALNSVVLPLLGPSVATAAVMCSIFSWNEFFFALIFTTDEARTYPVLVSSYITDSGPEWGTIAATSLVAVLPVIACCLFLQRYLIHGLSAGAVK